jgi:hypothetical protein
VCICRVKLSIVEHGRVEQSRSEPESVRVRVLCVELRNYPIVFPFFSRLSFPAVITIATPPSGISGVC